MSLLRKITPKPLVQAYHYCLAVFAAYWYRFPSRFLRVVGITGTNGKSSTTMLLGRLLEHAGYRVGWTSTAGFKVAESEWENTQKMTMLGRFQTHKLLRRMVRKGCDVAIVETSSQGLVQFRHIGISYDMAVFTNLTPEHIEAHGGFEAYKAAKQVLFDVVSARRAKQVNGQDVLRRIVVNASDEHAPDFVRAVDEVWGYSYTNTPHALSDANLLQAEEITYTDQGTTFRIGEHAFSMSLVGEFNFYNVLCALTCARALGVSWKELQAGVEALASVPGRLERISSGQPFTVVVDYAYEPAAVEALYASVSHLSSKRMIHLLGSAGGGRDVARRTQLGSLAASVADVVIVANEDPYDEDPMQIINDVADAAKKGGKVDGETLFRILDRQEAITKACSLAEPGDLVLITGKGSEPVMAVADGKKIPWDDRDAVRTALETLGYGQG